MSRVVGIATATIFMVLGVVMSAVPASAEGERRGNWDLYVDASGCAYDWEDQAWCGPDLVVHADVYIYDDDRYSATMRLIGPNGDVPLQYGANARYSQGRGASSTDPNYWGPSFEKRTPTGGLAPGRYGVTLSVDVSGRWSCSIYSRDVCNFLEPKSNVYAWVFDWNGASIQVPTINLMREAETNVVGRNTNKPWVLISAAAQPAKEGTPVTIQRQNENGKWQTVTQKKSGPLGYVTYTDKKAPKAKKVRYRIFASDAPDFALTVIARTK